MIKMTRHKFTKFSLQYSGKHKRTRIWVSTTSHDQDDKKQTVFKSYKQMKNLQHTQLIVTIALSLNGGRKMYHPPKIVTLTIPSLIDVCGSNCRTYLKLKIFLLFAPLQICC